MSPGLADSSSVPLRHHEAGRPPTDTLQVRPCKLGSGRPWPLTVRRGPACPAAPDRGARGDGRFVHKLSTQTASMHLGPNTHRALSTESKHPSSKASGGRRGPQRPCEAWKPNTSVQGRIHSVSRRALAASGRDTAEGTQILTLRLKPGITPAVKRRTDLEAPGRDTAKGTQRLTLRRKPGITLAARRRTAPTTPERESTTGTQVHHND